MISFFREFGVFRGYLVFRCSTIARALRLVGLGKANMMIACFETSGTDPCEIIDIAAATTPNMRSVRLAVQSVKVSVWLDAAI